MPLMWVIGTAAVLSLLAACGDDKHGLQGPGNGNPDPRPVGLVWGSGASGAFVEDTVPLVTFYEDSAGNLIGLPRPVVTWSSSDPSILSIVSETLAVALDTGAAILTAVHGSAPSITLQVPVRVIPRWQARFVWVRQPERTAQVELAVQDLPGHQVRQLADIGYPGQAIGDPYLSTDGSTAAVVGTRKSAPLANITVFLVDLRDGSRRAPLDSMAGHQNGPVWFPGDSVIGFMANRSGAWEVWTSRPDGSDIRQRTLVRQTSPRFFDRTPEAHIILPLRTLAGAVDLFELTLAGDTVRQLSATPDYEEHTVAVSPDGQTIAFDATLVDGMRASEHSRVWLMKRDGSNARPLLSDRRLLKGIAPHFTTYLGGYNSAPSWSPDGNFVLLTWYVDAYLRSDRLVYEMPGDIYAIRVADGLAIRLTTSAVTDGQPVLR